MVEGTALKPEDLNRVRFQAGHAPEKLIKRFWLLVKTDSVNVNSFFCHSLHFAQVNVMFHQLLGTLAQIPFSGTRVTCLWKKARMALQSIRCQQIFIIMIYNV